MRRHKTYIGWIRIVVLVVIDKERVIVSCSRSDSLISVGVSGHSGYFQILIIGANEASAGLQDGYSHIAWETYLWPVQNNGTRRNGEQIDFGWFISDGKGQIAGSASGV